MKKLITILSILMLIVLSGCNTVISDTVKEDEDEEVVEAYNLSFNESDTDASYQINGSTLIELGSEDVKITKGGTYILQGTLDNASVIVEVEKDIDVQLVLNNATINSGDFAGIYIVEGDEITITLAEGSVNTISDSSSYTQIDDNNVDALIYSKADLIINGNGTLNLKSDYNHGIVSKDDLVITGGSYNIETAGQGLSGKDALMISNGNFKLTTYKDSLKSDNSEDEYRGYVYISGGTFVINSYADAIYGTSLVNIEGGNFTINTAESNTADSYKAIKSDNEITISGGTFVINSVDDAIHSDGDITIDDGSFDIVSSDDAIHADKMVTINGGDFTIEAHEGIEGTYIKINGGDIDISASDDGINAAQKVSDYTATFEMNDGNLSVNMGQGDTDAIDSNGYIYINGGTINITAQSAFDYDSGAEHNGGTIIINGTETDEITNQFGGGMQGFGGGMQHGFGGMNQDGNTQNEQNIPGGGQTPPDGQNFTPGSKPGGGHFKH